MVGVSMIFTLLNRDEFDDFSRVHADSAFVQSKQMAELLELQKRKVLIFGVKENNQIIAAGLFSLRKIFGPYNIGHCNQGPLIDWTNQELVKFFFQNLKQALKPYKCINCVITPNFEVYPRDINGEICGEDNNLNIIDYLNQIGVIHQGYDNSAINGVGRWFFYKDFSGLKNKQDLLDSFDHATRQNIRKTIKNNLSVSYDGEERLAKFVNLMEKTAARRDFDDRGLSYYRNLKQAFGESARLYLAELNIDAYKDGINQEIADFNTERAVLQERVDQKMASKKTKNRIDLIDRNLANLFSKLQEIDDLSEGEKELILAGIIYIKYGNEMTALFGGNDERYFGFNGAHAIHWTVMSNTLGTDCTRFNFYGTSGKYSGAEDDGNYRFKKGFGGRVVEQPGNFVLVVNSFMNSLYNIARKFKNR